MSWNLVIFAVILMFTTHTEMVAEARGPIISFRCHRSEDCGSVCAKCPTCTCLFRLCTCPTDPPWPLS
ncbi:hypothetical protein ES288_D07G114400v1 [Gossypium darwinii]|uniref:Uncharacterized protein n=1 Tax=Gossypium darwinii TaxID=34276 RepID=A0A5D2BUJ6_GOSDA|nr:hypothetical protein ES288_D07G114400v1 [Gossypium darwinii]